MGVGTQFGLFGYFADITGSPTAGSYTLNNINGLPLTRLAATITAGVTTNILVQVHNNTASTTIDKNWLNDITISNANGGPTIILNVAAASFVGGSPGASASWIWDIADGVNAIQPWFVGERHSVIISGGVPVTPTSTLVPVTPTPTETLIPPTPTVTPNVTATPTKTPAVTPTPAVAPSSTPASTPTGTPVVTPTSTPAGVNITNQVFSHFTIDGTYPRVAIDFGDDGQFSWRPGLAVGFTNVAGEWVTTPGGSIGSNYELLINYTVTQGNAAAVNFTGVTGVWISMNLGALFEWATNVNLGSSQDLVIAVTAQIRPAGGGAVLDTATYTINMRRTVINR
jgi:hypothetical protein